MVDQPLPSGQAGHDLGRAPADRRGADHWDAVPWRTPAFSATGMTALEEVSQVVPEFIGRVDSDAGVGRQILDRIVIESKVAGITPGP